MAAMTAMTARSDKARRLDPPNVTMSNETTEHLGQWLVELLVHSDPGPMVRECLGLAQILALSRACKSLHKLMLNETTRARNFWASMKGAAAWFGIKPIGHASYHAAEGGYLSMLAYLHEHGYMWNGSVCAVAACSGHLACLQYAHEHGCEWNEETCEAAAEKGHLACLQYAHESGCEWNEETCEAAARGGQLHCLQYAHENGCPWTKDTCEMAANNGKLDCLQYAHEHGCPWDENACMWASMACQLDCLEYLREKNCPGWEEYCDGRL